MEVIETLARTPTHPSEGDEHSSLDFQARPTWASTYHLAMQYVAPAAGCQDIDDLVA